MDLEKIREQVNLMDIKAVSLRHGLDRLISGVVANIDSIELTDEQKTALQVECLKAYGEVKELITMIDLELSN